MHNITIISAMYIAVGECNSIALYKILLAIRPDMIFEEMPPTYFSKYYLERSKRNMEVEAITMYNYEFSGFQSMLKPAIAV